MLSSSIKISISKESQSPIRDQLIEQIGLQIASGSLKPKDKLPSIRALAQRLGIHQNTITAAYNHLKEVGLLEIYPGSGVCVASHGLSGKNEDNEQSIEQFFNQFLTRAVESGLSKDDIKSFTEQRLKTKPIKRLLIIDNNADFHPVITTQLQPHFSFPVQPVTFDQIATQQELLDDSLIITSFYHLYPFLSFNFKINPTRFLVCTVEPGNQEMDALKNLPDNSLVAFISISPTLLKMANNMIAALRGKDVAVRCLLLNEEPEIIYVIKHAKLLICDASSKDLVQSLAAKTPTKIFQLYSTSTIQLIKDRLAKWG